LAIAGGVATASLAQAEPVPKASTTPSEATITLVGAAGHDPELEALLRELLERRGVHAHLFQQSAFGHEQLLRAAAPGSGVLVFVVPEPAGNVGLYFRAPDGERFLLRSVRLRAGFDDVGRELVAQVVETAVVSLLHSGDGLTLEQARLALANNDSTGLEAEKPPPPAAPATTAAPIPTKAAGPPQRARPTALEGWFALRYGALALGPQPGVTHGPGAELGLGVKRGLLLRARATFERDFPQSFETSRIAAELTRTRLRFALDAGLPLSHRERLLISLGIGQDRLSVKPSAAAGSSVAPAPAFEDRAPIAQAELRYEVALDAFRVAATVGADVSLVQTHYDLARGAERQSVLRPWLVRPTAGFALAFCPRWTTF
jgi:hypothetical protein